MPTSLLQAPLSQNDTLQSLLQAERFLKEGFIACRLNRFKLLVFCFYHLKIWFCCILVNITVHTVFIEQIICNFISSVCQSDGFTIKVTTKIVFSLLLNFTISIRYDKNSQANIKKYQEFFKC